MEQPGEYRITVSGTVGNHWSSWLEGFRITHGTGSQGQMVTMVSGWIRDQSELRGLINRIWDLNLSVLSVVRLTEGGHDEEVEIERT